MSSQTLSGRNLFLHLVWDMKPDYQNRPEVGAPQKEIPSRNKSGEDSRTQGLQGAPAPSPNPESLFSGASSNVLQGGKGGGSWMEINDNSAAPSSHHPPPGPGR